MKRIELTESVLIALERAMNWAKYSSEWTEGKTTIKAMNIERDVTIDVFRRPMKLYGVTCRLIKIEAVLEYQTEILKFDLEVSLRRESGAHPWSLQGSRLLIRKK